MARKQFVMVGKEAVDVCLPKRIPIITFTDGQYVFWTAIFANPVDGKRKIWGRARVGLSAGDRFDRMRYERYADDIPKADHRIYHNMWFEQLQQGRNIKYIRPSTLREVARWMNTHPKQRAQLVASDFAKA